MRTQPGTSDAFHASATTLSRRVSDVPLAGVTNVTRSSTLWFLLRFDNFTFILLRGFLHCQRVFACWQKDSRRSAKNLAGMVGTAHQRSGGDMSKTDAFGLFRQKSESVRVDIINHRQMLPCWPQILANGQ